MMTAFRRLTKSTTEHLGAARFNRPPLPAKRHGFSPPFTVIDVRIGKLRQKIGDDPDKPTYIHTVRGTGYRFSDFA